MEGGGVSVVGEKSSSSAMDRARSRPTIFRQSTEDKLAMESVSSSANTERDEFVRALEMPP